MFVRTLYKKNVWTLVISSGRENGKLLVIDCRLATTQKSLGKISTTPKKKKKKQQQTNNNIQKRTPQNLEQNIE